MYKVIKITLSILAFNMLNILKSQNIEGVVTDKITGEPLTNTQIKNLNSGLVVNTNIYGKFSIKAKENLDSLRISNIGYRDLTLLSKNLLHAELSSKAIALNEIVVSVNREHQSRVEAPVAISTITTMTIEDTKPTTIDEVLNRTAGVNMVNLGQEQHTMSIRRPIDYGASYLYLEDGIPIRASGVFNHNALLEINMPNIGKIELIRGPASSFYGSEAIGGAINFISKRPSIKPNIGVSLQGNNIGYRRTDFYATNTFDKIGVRFSGYYAGSRNGVKDYSDFDKLGLSFSTLYNLTDKTELNWANTFIDYKSNMGGSLDSADFYSKSYVSNQTFTYRKVKSFRSKLALSHIWSKNGKSSFTGYFRSNSTKQNPSYRIKDDYKPWNGQGNPNLAFGQENDNNFNSYGVITQHRQRFDWSNSRLIAGISLDYSPNNYFSEKIKIFKNNNGVYESFTKTDEKLADYQAKIINIAGYLQGSLELIENLKLIGALRIDNFTYKFKNNLDKNSYTSVIDGENYFKKITPKLGATYNFKQNTGTYINYSQGFVPPQVSELYVGQSIPTLKPVYYNNYELGGWISFFDEKAKLDISFYNMNGINEIISVLQDDGSRIRKNSGKTTHKGIEFTIQSLPIEEVNISLSGTYAKHKFLDYKEKGVDYSGNEMPQAPNLILNSQIIYKPKVLNGFRTSLEWRHIDPYFMNANNKKVYEGYNVFNLRFGYRKEAFEIWLNILNITNQLYSTVARANAWGQSYSLGNPINFNVGIGYNFKSK